MSHFSRFYPEAWINYKCKVFTDLSNSSTVAKVHVGHRKLRSFYCCKLQNCIHLQAIQIVDEFFFISTDLGKSSFTCSPIDHLQ